jgi:hypothetical protein
LSINTIRGIAYRFAAKARAIQRAGRLDWGESVVGRRVVTQSYPHVGRGWQRILFDARSASGVALPAGVYFYKVRAGGETRTHKMVITR